MLISQRRSFPRGRISHVRLEKEGEAEAAAAAAEKAVLDPDLSISFSWVKHFFSASSFLFLSLPLLVLSFPPAGEELASLRIVLALPVFSGASAARALAAPWISLARGSAPRPDQGKPAALSSRREDSNRIESPRATLTVPDGTCYVKVTSLVSALAGRSHDLAIQREREPPSPGTLKQTQ